MNALPYRQVHLDFHTPRLPFKLGKNFNKDIFQKTLKQACVNSITLTGRCHHGYIYYKTDLPAEHPQMENDFLMEEIDACYEIGIRAPIYLTVGWDAFSADHHPEWLERKKDGSLYGFGDTDQLSPDWKTLCFNTAYLDYLKEQIIDTIKHFGKKLDGLFFDIVWQDSCYCSCCTMKMIEKNYDIYSEKARERFAKETEQFLKDEIYQTIQSINPTCPIFFNEGNILPTIRTNLHEYSHLEIESLPSGEWGYQHFPTVVRYAKNLGKEYVGMTGKFHKVWADFGSYKNKAALEYETFLALAHGAKCSIGDQMYPDGTLQLATYDLIGSVYTQVKEIEKYNDNTLPITELAIVHPGICQISEEKVDLSLAGAVNMLNEAHYQFDIIDDQMDWQAYKMIILPDKIVLNATLKNKLRTFQNQGGKILASYHSGLDETNHFPASWQIEYIDENSFIPTYGTYKDPIAKVLPKGELVLHGKSALICSKSNEVLGKEIHPLYQRNFEHYYSHFQAPANKESAYPVTIKNDSLVYFTHPLFEMYKLHGMKPYKSLIIAALEYLLNDQKVVKTNLPATAEIVLNHKKEQKQLIINILHYIPERKAVLLDTIEEAIPLKDNQIELNLEKIGERTKTTIQEITTVKSIRKKVTNLPFHQKNDENNKLFFNIPEINGYQLITINYK
ncbi:alpha-amylase family protein [Melissococcus plutonius]|uniref:alpha-amylase family protein n=1 Tax=Melissococcus plutonius TaxID=33970 RepID=UPI003C2B01C8